MEHPERAQDARRPFAVFGSGRGLTPAQQQSADTARAADLERHRAGIRSHLDRFPVCETAAAPQPPARFIALGFRFEAARPHTVTVLGSAESEADALARDGAFGSDARYLPLALIDTDASVSRCALPVWLDGFNLRAHRPGARISDLPDTYRP